MISSKAERQSHRALGQCAEPRAGCLRRSWSLCSCAPRTRLLRSGTTRRLRSGARRLCRSHGDFRRHRLKPPPTRRTASPLSLTLLWRAEVNRKNQMTGQMCLSSRGATLRRGEAVAACTLQTCGRRGACGGRKKTAEIDDAGPTAGGTRAWHAGAGVDAASAGRQRSRRGRGRP